MHEHNVTNENLAQTNFISATIEKKNKKRSSPAALPSRKSSSQCTTTTQTGSVRFERHNSVSGQNARLRRLLGQSLSASLVHFCLRGASSSVPSAGMKWNFFSDYANSPNGGHRTGQEIDSRFSLRARGKVYRGKRRWRRMLFVWASELGKLVFGLDHIGREKAPKGRVPARTGRRLFAEELGSLRRITVRKRLVWWWSKLMWWSMIDDREISLKSTWIIFGNCFSITDFEQIS